jgi:hypothetical protein
MRGTVQDGGLRVLYLGVMSVLIGITTVVLAIAARLGVRFTGTDAMYIAESMSVMGVFLILYYRKVLGGMVRQGSLSVWRIALITILGLNLIAYYSSQRLYHGKVHWVAGEEWFFMLGYAVLGLCFSVGYATTFRPAATYDPKSIHLVTD